MQRLPGILTAVAVLNLLLVGISPAWAESCCPPVATPCEHGGEMPMATPADSPDHSESGMDCADMAACCLGGVSPPQLPTLDEAPMPEAWLLSGPLPPRPAAIDPLLRPPIA